MQMLCQGPADLPSSSSNRTVQPAHPQLPMDDHLVRWTETLFLLLCLRSEKNITTTKSLLSQIVNSLHTSPVNQIDHFYSHIIYPTLIVNGVRIFAAAVYFKWLLPWFHCRHRHVPSKLGEMQTSTYCTMSKNRNSCWSTASRNLYNDLSRIVPQLSP